MNKPIEYSGLKINIHQALRKINDADRKRDYVQAQYEALEVLVNARLLYQAYGSWLTGQPDEGLHQVPGNV